MVSHLVLIIWDDPDTRTLLQFALEQNGYDVLLANSFNEGFVLCNQNRPDLLMMPHYKIGLENGLDFCRKLRSDIAFGKLPIIIGFIDHTPREWRQAYEPAFVAGANACFGRVFDISDVIEQVRLLITDPTLTNLPDKQSLKFG